MPVSDSGSESGSSKDEENKRNKIYIPDDFGKLDVRIGKVVKIALNPFATRKKPCFVADVDVGEDEPRTVGSELNHFYKVEELTGRLVVVLCNVRPKKKCNLLSDAWVLSACSEEKKLELLDPPQDSEAGEQVSVEGYPTISDIRDEKLPRTVSIKRILRDVRVGVDKVVAFRRSPLRVEGKKFITTKSLTDCMVTDSFLSFCYKQRIKIFESI